MAKKTVKKSNTTVKGTNAADIITITGSGNKIYAKGGNDKITLNKGQLNLIDAGKGNDTIIIGKKAGNDNTFMAGAGNDTITVSGGTQIIDGGAGADRITVSGGTQTIEGGAGNDTITVKGGNNHTLSGGAGSDKYIINVAMSKNTLLTIDQSDAGKKDKDILQLSKVSKNDVKLGLANGTLSIKHKTGGGIIVEGYDKKLSKIQFKDGTMSVAAVQKTSKKTKATAVTWNMGGKASVDAKKVVSTLQITGHRVTDFIVTPNDKKVILQDADGGMLIINNWNSSTISQFVFIAGGERTTLTAEQFSKKFDEGFDLNLVVDGQEITGTVNNDIITVTGNENEIFGNEGNDKLSISGDFNALVGGDGNDEMLVMSGRNNHLFGEEGNDTLMVNGGEWNDLHGDAGDDTFIVNGGNGFNLWGDEGNDAVIVNGGNDVTVTGGPGSDTFIINKVVPETDVSILQDDDIWNAGDKDVLQLPTVNMNDVIFSSEDYISWDGENVVQYDNYWLYCDIGGGQVKIRGWNLNPLDRIEFADGTMSKDEINGEVTAVTWNMGGTASVDANKVASRLNITGHRETEYYAMPYDGSGNMVLYDDNGGSLTISNWDNNTISQFVFSAGGQKTTLTAAEFNSRIINGDTRYIVENNQNIQGTANNDKLSVNGVYSYIYGGAGNDRLTIVDGQMVGLHGEEGDDTLIVNGGQYLDVHGGPGSDTYVFNGDPSNLDGIIHQEDGTAGDKDVLQLTNVSKNDILEFTLSQDGGQLGIDLGGGNGFRVSGWDVNPLDSIRFSDGVMTKDEINSKTVLLHD